MVAARLDGQPRRIYVGYGRAAQQQAARDAEACRQRQREREAVLTEMAHVAVADGLLHDLRTLVMGLVTVTLIESGHHNHKGTWRRRHARDRHPQRARST